MGDALHPRRTSSAVEEEDVPLVVRERSRRGAAVAHRVLESAEGVRTQSWIATLAQSARAAAFVCDPPPRAWRRPSHDPGDARARRPLDDTDLHARPGSAVEGGLRSLPPAELGKGRTAHFKFQIPGLCRLG